VTPLDVAQYGTMTVYDWNSVPEEQLNASLSRQMFHTRNMTVARLTLRKHAVVPAHSHVNEQVSMVEKGALKWVLGGEERVVHAGQILHIPSGVVHSAEALEDTVALDLFAPAREDWIRGDDAYLRR
jgi:quercetin dioxygenase-like cupin family protein